jgi:hypothetical protein
MSTVKLKDANHEPDEATVAALRESLELAESGKLRSVAIAGNLTGHRTYTNFATSDLQETIGLVSFVHHTLCARLRESRE